MAYMHFLLVMLASYAASVPRAPLNQENLKKLATASNELAIDLHKKLSAEDKNVFTSPLSVNIALAMLYHGTRGHTAEELHRMLGYADAGLSSKEVHESYRNLLEALSESPDEYLLEVANSVLAQNNYPILADYKNDLLNFYQATVRDVDFYKESEKVVGEINEWVKLKTKGKIEKLLEELDPATRMVLLNAVYFKGTWQTEFDPEHTTNGIFYNNGQMTSPKQVPMMRLQTELPYARLGGVRVLQLPYKGNDVSMLILLPDAIDGLSGLEAVLQTRTLGDLKDLTKKENVDVMMPKFKMEYTKELKEILQGLGIKSIFEDDADLSGISQSNELKVTSVMHKAVVDVNEEGSEAAGVTGVIIETRMGFDGVVFDMNHPFLFAIMDNRNNMILFLGRVSNF